MDHTFICTLKTHAREDIAVPDAIGPINGSIAGADAVLGHIEAHLARATILIVIQDEFGASGQVYGDSGGGIGVIVEIIDRESIAAVQTEPIAIVAANGDREIADKASLEPITDAELSGGNRTAVGIVGAAAAAESFVEIGAGGGAFGNISLVAVLEIHAFEDIAVPNIISAICGSIALGGSAGLCLDTGGSHERQ